MSQKEYYKKYIAKHSKVDTKIEIAMKHFKFITIIIVIGIIPSSCVALLGEKTNCLY